MLDQHAAGSEYGVDRVHQASRAIDGIARGQCPLACSIADERRSADHRIVAVRIDKLRRDHRVQRRADHPHVVGMNGDSRPDLDPLAYGGALDGAGM